MREEEIQIRNVRRKDYKAIVSSIAETWGYYKRHKNPRTARRVAAAYWYSALMDHTFSAVAVCGGECAGVLLGRCDAELPKRQRSLRKYRRRALWIQFLLSFSEEVRKSAVGSERIEEADRKMLENLHRHFDGELVFFLLRKEYRRKGIGRKLLRCFVEYMKEKGCRNFYVYTDEYCDFVFYEKLGFLRVGEEEVQLPHLSAPSHFFLYQYRL